MSLVNIGIWICCLALISCPTIKKDMSKTNYEHVDPFIGTGGHGHVFPGATRPFGMVQLSPDTHTEGWDWCSGYHYTDSSIIGFSHTHLSGTGRGDLMDILLMPTTGVLKLEPGSRENPDEGYRSRFSHNSELASPGYYSVLLEDYSIRAELTTTHRAGFHRYTFPESSESRVLIDLLHGYSTDTLIEASITIVNDSVVTGYRKTKGWGEPGEDYFSYTEVYFSAHFSKPFGKYGIYKDGAITNGNKATGKNIKAHFDYSTSRDEQILVKVGISSVDTAGATSNVLSEIPGWNFNLTWAQAREEWEAELDKIAIEASEEVKTTYYTALYHTMIAPYIFSDVDGRYRGFDNKIHRTTGSTNYTVFSLWDTFRATFPLYTLIQQERIPAMINSFYNQYVEHGLLPVWPLWGSETNCMIGYHAIPVITDAYLKGIPGIDIQKLYPAMKKSAMQRDFGIQYLMEYNYIPFDKENKSVSKTLEYAFDDWCIAQVAHELGYVDDYKYFKSRSNAYVHLFDKEYQLMNGKSSTGEMRRPFDPTFASYVECDFVEGNSWQYSFFVPHDIPGLIKLYGGNEPFVAKLDQLFSVETSSSNSKPIDITGLIGEYAHGNEPSHHVAYLFNYADQPSKTQYWVNKIMTSLYTSKPDGLCGNEDCGQMSAWYVFSALGFYPVNPASGMYNIGSPLVESATIFTRDGKFDIFVKNKSPNNIYVQKIELNGKPLHGFALDHKDIVKPGTLVFYMGPDPGKSKMD